MKKLSFFLMAMLISVMSFAETELFTQTYPGSPSSYTNAYTKSFTVTTGDYTLTYTNINNGQASNAWTAIRSGSKNGASVATIASEQIAAPIAKVVINFTQANASSTNALYLEVSANSDFSSATKIAADIAVGNVEFPIAAPAANQYYKITIDQAKGSANGFNRFDKVVFYQGEAAGEDVEIVAAPEFSVTEANFTTAFTLDITSEEGTTLKYTIDNTDPSTSATAIEVATNSTSVQITKSTAVKAIAIKGELKSVTKSKVYCYVNSAETAYTVAEAMEVIDAGLGLANELYVKGEISEIEKFDANYGSITYWIKDEEDNKFECYSGLGLNKAKFTSIEDVEVGASVVACGVMKLFVTSSGDKIYEFNYNNYLVEYVAPVVNHTIAVSANPAEGGVVTGGGEFEETDEITVKAVANDGYEFVNWTENEEEVSTDAEYTFAVLADRALVANFEKAAPATETVYFINAKKWAKVNVYAWTTDPIVAWPGAAATKEAEQIAGFDVYSYTLNAGAAANVIFNDGSSQTPDLVWTAGKYYVIDMGWLTKEEAETKLAAPLPETWNIVGAAGLMGKDWDLNAAENAMTKQEDGTYKLEKKGITIVAGSYEYKAAKDHGWTVAVPQDGNQKLKITTSGIYDVTFVLNVTAKTLQATATLKQAAVVIPTVIIAGDMNSWSQTKDKFTMSADSLTATFKATLAVKNYGFKMIVGGAWHSDGKTITRAANSTKFTGANSNTNSTLKADIAGEYLFTWEYATKTLTVTYPTPVTKYTVTLSDNTGGFEPLTSGAGEYEEGDEVTVSAVDSEGWVFVGWMDENGDIVSNDYQYTFVIEGNVALVAIYAQLMALEVNDLEIITEPVVGLTGTAELMPGTTLSFELIVDDSEQGEDGEFYLTEDSKVYLNDETELEFLEGIALIDLMSNTAQAQVLAAMGETLYLFNLDMSAAPAEPVDLVVTDATIYEENGILFLTAPWEGKTIKAELPATEHQGWMMIEIHEGEEFSIAMSQNATIATVDNVLTITGVFTDNWTGDVYNVTISGKLPVVEPTTITYELNGGEFPAVVVPTNAELWGTDTADVNGFMHYYNHYYGLKRATQTIENVASFAYAQMQQIMTDEASAYKWLGDYVQSVATAAGKPLSTDMAAANESGWRWSVWAFFNACAGKNGSVGIDFTEAGKPEAWGAAYQAAHEVVLPTEPVAEDYVLPTPVKEGYTFVGWYDNAEGTGEAYTVIPAGWAGTLYAIWEVEGPATALENIAVEGKAVKAIINGQLIIIKNGVQYNAQGQVVK